MLKAMPNIGKYLLNKRSHAILAALLLSLASIIFIPFYVCVAIIIALVTLHKGSTEGLITLVWVLLPVVAVSFVQPIQLAAVVIMFNYVVVWVLASVLRKFRAWSLMLEVAVACGLLAVVIINVYFPHLHQMMAVSVATFINERQKLEGIKVSPEDLKLWIQALSTLMIGFSVMQLLVFNVVCLIVSRAWQASMFNPGGFLKEFKQIRIGKLLSFILLATIVLALFDTQFALQIFPILMLPYFFAALSLAHFLASKNPNKQAMLLILYISCLIFYTVMFLGLTFIGIIDSWYDFRKKIANHPA